MADQANRRHPSGRPIRPNAEKSIGFYRVPREDYATPRLQRGSNTAAIGFTARLTREDGEDGNA
jgi:hypothetical protein